MSSSEEYLDSLLDSILSGGKSEEEENAAEASQGALAESRATDAGKAMSPDEIEEMLVSMGTLGGEEEGTQEQNPEEDMEAMLAFMNEHSADETDSDGLGEDSVVSEDFVTEDMPLDDSVSEEIDEGGMDALDDLSLDGLDMGDGGTEEFSMDELPLEEQPLEEMETEGTDEGGMDALDDLSLDDLDMGDSGTEELSMDELSLDGLELDDSSEAESAGDGASDDFTIDELSLDDLSSEETEETEGGIDELDELSLDDLSSEEPENTEEDEDGLMSEEDIDRLLNGDMSTEEEAADDFALEETEGAGDDDLSALLAGMDHDEDLSEINDLLGESDQGVSPDDDMLAMLEGVDEDGSFDLFESDEAAKEAEGIRELSPEEVAEREGDGDQGKNKKKRKKLFGKKKKGAEDEIDALLGEGDASEEPQKEKKPGFIARLLEFLLESDEDDEDPLAAEILAGNDGETGTVSDENKELLQELSDEDKKGKKKKKKKDKKKKGKEGEEDDKKAKKPKKEKKKKEKKKKEDEVDLFAPPEKKLSKKKVITAFLFCGTIGAGIIVLSRVLPDTVQKKNAYTAYDRGEYAQVYDLLYGKTLNEQDEVIFQGSNLILQMDRKLTSYDNYISLDMKVEALNALITGVERYQKILPEAESYNVVTEVNDIYSQILERLSAFGLSEGDAWDILASEDDVTYTQRLQAIVNGELYGAEEAEEVEEGVQDVLPEEEEIIERIGGMDGETEIVTEPAEENVIGGMDGETEIVIEPSPEEVGTDDQASDENADEGAE